MFLYLVESGLRGGDACFIPRTFGFLQVCRRWNEVGVNFPRLWSSWVAGANKAWPLFNSRSKDTPLSLSWRRRLPSSARQPLMDPAISKRIRQLDFSGTSDQLAYFLGAFNSSPPSNVSSIRLQITRHDDREPRERLARLLSASFPKLSTLNIGNFLPDLSSPLFTTSKLTSLKFFLPYEVEGHYTLARFSQLLQQHPNLQRLDLNSAAIPLPGTSEGLVSFSLPRLVDLRLHGMKNDILGFIDLIGMSSPLHNVIIHFDHVPWFTVPALAEAMEKIVVAYYDSQSLDHPRKIHSLTVSSPSSGLHLAFDARSRTAPPSNFKLKFAWIHQLEYESMVEETFDLLPSKDIQDFAVEGLPLTHRMFEKMKELSHLRISHQDTLTIGRAVDALSLRNRGASTASTTVTLNHLHTYR